MNPWSVVPGRVLMMLPLVTALLGIACSGGQQALPATSTADGGGQPKVNRLVMLVVSPAVLSMEIRNDAEPNSWPLRPMYDYLVGINNKTSRIEPGLLESWAYEGDGKALRAKLRAGALFHHDFGEVKASDVKFGWDRMVNAKPESIHGQLGFWRNISDIDMVNDHEVVFRLKSLDGNFVTGLSEQQGGIEVQSKANFDKLDGPATYATGPLAGSGPYQYTTVAEGQFIRFGRVPWKHWRATPDFPEFEFRFSSEASTRMAALLTGEVQMATLPEDLLQQAEKQGMKVVRGMYPGTRVYAAMECCALKDKDDPSKGWLYPDSPLMDVRVRRAINKSVNRDELNKSFFGGKGEVMYLNHMNPSRPGWNPDWVTRFQDAYGYDPAAARALLAQAGYGPGKPLKTNIVIQPLPGVGNGGDLSEALGGYMRAVGIEVTLLQPDTTEFTRVRRERGYSNHMTPSATGSNIWSGWTIWNSSNQALPTRVVDVAIDKLLRDLTATIDEKKRDELWRKVGDAGYDAFMNINMLWLPSEVVTNPKVVAGWVFPGDITGAYTHVWEIKAVK